MTNQTRTPEETAALVKRAQEIRRDIRYGYRPKADARRVLAHVMWQLQDDQAAYAEALKLATGS